MEDRIETYLSLCYEYGLPPTVEGMTMSIDYDRRAVYDLENRRKDMLYADTVKRYKDYIANYDATLAISNKTNAAIYCFRAKNMYGMKDVQEIQAVAAPDATKPRNAEEILEALPESPIGNEEE